VRRGRSLHKSCHDDVIGAYPLDRYGKFIGGSSMIRLGFLIIIFFASISPEMVEAKRVALVIGNSAYVNTGSLPNPVNDANIVADSARKAGFDDVTVALDLTVNSFQRELRTFREKADGADIAMIYYAGHGMEGQGANWLIPIDAKLDAVSALADEAINLDEMTEAVSGARIRMIVLDACRDNAFGNDWVVGAKTVTQGLAEYGADGVLVIFAAASGKTAVDGSGFNSPFAESLAKRLPQPGLPIQMLAGIVRDDVLAATGGSQRPFMSAKITGTPVYLVQATPADTSPAGSSLPGSGPASQTPETLAVVPVSVPPSEPERSTTPVDTGSTSEADLAYVPPATIEPALPALPPTPQLPAEGYPDCRESYQVFVMPFDKAEDINQCTSKLDNYYSEILTPFRERMIEHQNVISQLYIEKVGGNEQYSPKSQKRFYEMMMKEHAASDPEGVNLAAYRTAEARYQADREYLQDRYCFNTGCGGYPVPEFDVELALAQPKLRMDRSAGLPEGSGQIASADDPVEDRKKSSKKNKKKKKKSGPQKCKGAKSGGGLIGGLLGGVIGDAAGLGNVGTLIAGGVGAVIGAEIACQLDQQEQEKAAEATMVIVEKEEVGAVATWQSPTRSGVSGSSTVTALTSEPDGRRCLSITDIAIIDGEETKIAKQMCRGPGETNYSLMA